MNHSLEEYIEKRKDLIYCKAIKDIIKVFSSNDKTILDVGSGQVDLMSEFPFKERYSVALKGAIDNDKVKGFKMDFFDFQPRTKFDVVTCLQCIEHIEEARKFTQKLLKTGRILIISLPYKWKKGHTRSHIQDPIDEKKIFSWTDRKSKFTLHIQENNSVCRIICIYGNWNLFTQLKLCMIKKRYLNCHKYSDSRKIEPKNKIVKQDSSSKKSFIQNILHMENSCDKKHKIIKVLGLKIKIKLRQKKLKKHGTLSSNTKNPQRRKLIAVCGFWCSGSSTVCDMLSEFKNTTSFSHRKIYSGKINKKNNIYCEIKFFQDPYSIFKLISSFKSESDIEQDYAIKRFIDLFYSYHDENKDNPLFQNDFLKINTDFLENILELDNYTKKYMRKKRYPHILSERQNNYKKCCFFYNYPNHPYVFYKFKKLSDEEFDAIVSDYMNNFFNNIKGLNNLILDQLFSSDKFLLDKINFYLKDNPIKEICVWRDPRDQYINLLKEHPKFAKVEPKDFILWHQRNCAKKLNNSSENRLCVRFEDMILNYDETVKKIIDFLGLDEKDHIYKKQIFIPEKSKVNIGEYKEFHNQEIIKEIEEELKDFLYN